MKCYICDKELGKYWQSHVLSKHPKFLPCFEHLMAGNKAGLNPSKREGSGLTFDGKHNFEDICESKKLTMRHHLLDFELIGHLEPIPRSKKLSAYFVDPKKFGYLESVTAIRKVPTKKVLERADYTAQILCQHCGGYGKRKHCPPNVPDTFAWKKRLSKFTWCLIVVLQSDGRAGWSKHPDGKTRQWGRALLGVDNGLSYYLVDVLLSMVQAWGLKDYHLATAGPCKRCHKGCNLLKGLPCKFPLKGAVSLEGMGIDVTQLMQGLRIPYQMPAFEFVTKVGALFF